MNRLFFLIILLLYSCNYPEIISDQIVYYNDFEGDNFSEIDGKTTSTFNDTTVLGDFNNDGFTLHLNDVSDHDYIYVSFDLYVHGSWDGNFNGFKNNDKPDLWILEVEPDMDLMKDNSIDRFITTFSNSPCFSNYCLRQSYPDKYPSEYEPKTGHDITNLSKICPNSFFGGETTLYRIEKVFKHSGNAIILRFYDELFQPNAIDKDGNIQFKCDESWSIDNLKVRTILYS